MPEASVIRRPQALSGITGRKACVGGFNSGWLNSEAQPRSCPPNVKTRAGERPMELTK